MKEIKFDMTTKTLLFIFAMYIISQMYFGVPIRIISWDVLGYYLYLPYGLIENDLTFSDLSHIRSIVDQYDNTSTLYQLTEVGNGNRVIKYSIGMAIMNLPFFLTGHLIALLFNYPADGFSAPYEVMMLVANWFYLLVGFWYLRKVLLCFFDSKISSIVLFVTFIGTNYYYLALCQIGLSHGYLFALYAIGLYLTQLWHKEPTVKNSIKLGLVLGLMIITRPVEIFFLVIVIFWNVHSFNEFVKKYKHLLSNKLKELSLISLSIFIVGFIQLTYWKLISGNWFFYSYDNAGEGFDLLKPHTINFLFSFRKGWLLYTPVMIFAIIGLIYSFRKKYIFGLGLLFFFLLNLWIVSSWTCWWYAGSFSQRSMVQSYPVMAIGLGVLLNKVRNYRRIRAAIFVLMSLFVLLNLFQSWQLNNRILSDSRMTKEYYFKVFGKTYVPKKAEDLLLVERHTEAVSQPKNLDLYNQGTLNAFFDTISISRDDLFKDIFKSSFSQLTKKDHVWIKVSGSAIIDSLGAEEGFLIVSTFSHKEQNYSYLGMGYDKMSKRNNDAGDVEFSFWYLTPEVRSVEDEFVCYIWNRAGSNVKISNLKVQSFERLK